jgi:hypothetical protein
MTDQKQHMLANRIRRFLIASKMSDKLEFVNAILSFILTLLYAISTYWENSIIPNIVYFEMPILLYMLSDFLLNFYISLNRLYYVISIQSIITYITVLPDLLILSGLITDMNIINTYELPFWKVFRIFSVGRIQIVFVRRNMSLARVYFRLAFTLGSIVLLFACIMLMIENKFYIKPTLISVAGYRSGCRVDLSGAKRALKPLRISRHPLLRGCDSDYLWLRRHHAQNLSRYDAFCARNHVRNIYNHKLIFRNRQN